MIEAIVVLLVVLWGVGLAYAFPFGGLIHFLPVFAFVGVLLRVIQGSRIN